MPLCSQPIRGSASHAKWLDGEGRVSECAGVTRTARLSSVRSGALFAIPLLLLAIAHVPIASASLRLSCSHRRASLLHGFVDDVARCRADSTTVAARSSCIETAVSRLTRRSDRLQAKTGCTAIQESPALAAMDELLRDVDACPGDSLAPIVGRLRCASRCLSRGTERRACDARCERRFSRACARGGLASCAVSSCESIATRVAAVAGVLMGNPGVGADGSPPAVVQQEYDSTVAQLSFTVEAIDERAAFDGRVVIAVDASSLKDSDGDGLEEASVEVVELDLNGRAAYLSSLVQQIRVHLRSGTRSVGVLEETENHVPGVLEVAPWSSGGTAELRVGLYVEIDPVSMIGLPSLHNEQALEVSAVVSHAPVGVGEGLTATGASVLFISDDPFPLAFVAQGVVELVLDPPPCSHEKCTTGDPLGKPVCRSGCAALICFLDPWCCDVEWDRTCVSQVAAVCELGDCAFCGDGIVDAPEICDPPFSIMGCPDGSSCNATCDGCRTVCGDGRLAASEVCDPPFAQQGCPQGEVCSAACDGCVAICGDDYVAADEACDPPGSLCANGERCALDCGGCTSVCGDGIRDPGEFCDPPLYSPPYPGQCPAGETCAPDCGGCATTCGDGVIGEGEVCDPPQRPGGCAEGLVCGDRCDRCEAICGDGIVAPGEECDPISPEPGCSAGTQCTTGCRCLAQCGDGVVGPGEACDWEVGCKDGQECSFDCAACVSICGDGLVQPNEECDPPGSSSGCSPGTSCNGECRCVAQCGDDVVGPGEFCERRLGCAEPGTSCNVDCTACEPVCGDQQVGGNEECDPPGSRRDCQGDDVCQFGCRCGNTCGDFVVSSSEVCDPPGARSTCGDGFSCNATCTGCEALCGDDVLSGAELCDPPGSTTNCPTGESCAQDCSHCGIVCGDGQLGGIELCDPPGTQAQCSAGFICRGDCAGCDPEPVFDGCGDGIRTGTEDCDPPGAVDVCPEDTACDGRCRCQPICGDGIVGGSEECDPPGENGGCWTSTAAGLYGTCNDVCHCSTTASCGDGIVALDEQCDPPGMQGSCPSGTTCTDRCFCAPTCGDGVIAGDEICEPGQTPNCAPGLTCINCLVCAHTPYCGDGILDAGEVCDWNEEETLGCLPGQRCINCGSCGSVCGDGVVGPGEVCEPGAAPNGCSEGETCLWDRCDCAACPAAAVIPESGGRVVGRVALSDKFGFPAESYRWTSPRGGRATFAFSQEREAFETQLYVIIRAGDCDGRIIAGSESNSFAADVERLQNYTVVISGSGRPSDVVGVGFQLAITPPPGGDLP